MKICLRIATPDIGWSFRLAKIIQEFLRCLYRFSLTCSMRMSLKILLRRKCQRTNINVGHMFDCQDYILRHIASKVFIVSGINVLSIANNLLKFTIKPNTKHSLYKFFFMICYLFKIICHTRYCIIVKKGKVE